MGNQQQTLRCVESNIVAASESSVRIGLHGSREHLEGDGGADSKTPDVTSSAAPTVDGMKWSEPVTSPTGQVHDYNDDDDDDLRVLAEIEAFKDANLDANMDCEILLEILAAESERELQHEIATVQMDLQKGITDITNEDCDADLIEALRASAQTFEEERRLYHNVELT